MGDFLKASRQFLYRDGVYILGGASMLSALGISLGVDVAAEVGTLPVAIQVFAVGVCYGVGYGTYEGISLLGWRTGWNQRPGKVLSWLYRRLTGDEDGPGNLDRDVTLSVFLQDAPPALLDQYYRDVSLKHVGSVLGWEWLIALSLLTVGPGEATLIPIWAIPGPYIFQATVGEWVAGSGVFFVCVALLLAGQVKAVSQAVRLVRFFERLPSTNKKHEQPIR